MGSRYLPILYLVAEAQAAVVVPIPSFHVGELSLEEFDATYLDKVPVILKGTSTCPDILTSPDSLRPHCHGNVKDNVRKKTKGNTSLWAGLESGMDEDIDIMEYVDRMGSFDDLRYVFDLPTARVCPTLVPRVQLAPHFVNIFRSQFQDRDKFDIDYRKCNDIPFYNLYLADEGFESDLHVDSRFTAFTASMCFGQKRWRVISLANYSAFVDHLAEDNETQRQNLTLPDGRLYVGIKSPFDTWSSNSPLHSIDGLVIFEGILSPGETIMIPGGAPHAAITLNKSCMVASNDLTAAGVQFWYDLCKHRVNMTKTNDSDACDYDKQLLQKIEKYRNLEPRESKSFLKATGCEDKLKPELDKATAALPKDLVLINASNIDSVVSKGPLLVFKFSGSCIHCVRFKSQLKSFASRLSPSLQIAVVDRTPSDGNASQWRRVKQMLGGYPEMLLLKYAPGKGDSFRNETLNFTRTTYFGPRDIDMVLAWASFHSGSSVLGLSTPWKAILIVHQVVLWLLVRLVESCGYVAFADGQPWSDSILPDGGTIAVAGIAVGVVIVAMVFGACCCMRGRKQKSE